MVIKKKPNTDNVDEAKGKIANLYSEISESIKSQNAESIKKNICNGFEEVKNSRIVRKVEKMLHATQNIIVKNQEKLTKKINKTIKKHNSKKKS